MIKDALPDSHQTEFIVEPNNLVQNIQQAQEIIYNFFLEIVNQWDSELILLEFKHLFIQLIMPLIH
jgi:hypothetical protein